jgi:DNA polymerase-3 subunit delta'
MPFTASTALTLLQKAHANERLAHAYLITGPIGSGKRKLAAGLCELVLGKRGDDAFKHPDVHIAEPESKSRRILTEQIRALEHELRMRSSLGGRKVGIIFDADRLQPAAANAFLKTLEEPPGESQLLLLSAFPDQLLETILSRCLEVPLVPTERREASAVESKLLDALQRFSRGEGASLPQVFGLVRTFQQLLAEAREGHQGASETALKKEQQLYKQTSDGKWLDDREDYYKALTESRYQADRERLLATLEQWWVDVLRQQHHGPTLDLPQMQSATAALAARFSCSEILRKTAALEELRENLARTGVQEQLAIECAFLKAFGG